MRQIIVFLCLFPLLSACWQSTNASLPIIVKGEIRYLADTRQLNSEVYFFQGDSLANSQVFRPAQGSVTFLGSAMQSTELAGRQRWRSEMKVLFPEDLRFSFPTDTTSAPSSPRATLELQFSPPSTDSLPELLQKNVGSRFSAGSQALAANENIVVFFEPEVRNDSPTRIVIAGPTRNDKISLPANTLENIPAGNYEVYFVKQQMAKDTLPGIYTAIQIAYHTRPKKVVVE